MKKFIATFGALLTIGAHANVTYEYTGSAFITTAAPLAGANHAFAFITFAGPASSGNFRASDALDFGFSSGELSLSKAVGADLDANLVFDTAGKLVSWSFVVGRYGPNSDTPGLVELWSNSTNLVPSGDRVIATDGSRNLLAAYTPDAGVWVLVASPVPETSTLSMVSLGVILLMYSATRQSGRT